ncbi:MAG: cytochrome c [Acetobacteraceae bacterium]|jgi:mono/diheme cytochrome c family protein
MRYIARLLRRILIFFVLLALAAAAGAAIVIAWAPAISPVEPPDRASFSRAAILRGATLAALGDCAVCHTAPNGRPYAGGRGVSTPFGTVFATNITPDPATGVGRWSLAAFSRAMRDGIDRDGRHLYPVLPYPHFIRATDDDIAAIYAFLMTRTPLERVAQPNELVFPFNWRPLLAGWNLLFLRPGQWEPDPSKDAEWNQGAYLVDAIGHCGACHTPHNAAGAEQVNRALTGGEADGWYAPALRSGTQAPQAWTVDSLAAYLRTGFDKSHGAAAGPMAPVTHQLAAVPETDVRAVAVYIASLMPPAPAPAAERQPQPKQVADSPAFDGACGACHAAVAPMTRNGAPPLGLSTAVSAPTARNVVDLILYGIPWREGHAGPYMPAFSATLTDNQVAELATYVRARYGDQPAWPDVEATVREARRQGGGS